MGRERVQTRMSSSHHPRSRANRSDSREHGLTLSTAAWTGGAGGKYFNPPELVRYFSEAAPLPAAPAFAQSVLVAAVAAAAAAAAAVA